MWLSSVKKRLSQRCDDSTLISRPMGRLHLRQWRNGHLLYLELFLRFIFKYTSDTGACFTYKIQSPPCLHPWFQAPSPRLLLLPLWCVSFHMIHRQLPVCVCRNVELCVRVCVCSFAWVEMWAIHGSAIILFHGTICLGNLSASLRSCLTLSHWHALCEI